MTRHTVKSGDTLWKICKTHGVNIDEVAKLNGFTAAQRAKIYPGQKIILAQEPAPDDENCDSIITLRLIDIAGRPIKSATVQVEHDHICRTLYATENGQIKDIKIADITKGLVIKFKNIIDDFITIYNKPVAPIGGHTITLQSRSIKIKGSTASAEGNAQQTRKNLEQEISQRARPHNSDANNPRIVERDTTVFEKQIRMEGGKPTHVIAPVYTEGNLLLPPANEKYRQLILSAAQKHDFPPQGIAAIINIEARKKKGGEWDADCQNSAGYAGLTQFGPAAWIDVANDKRSLLAERVGKDQLSISKGNQAFLDLRFDPELSIDASMVYKRINLSALQKQYKINVNALNNTDKVKIAYLAHHEGVAGAYAVIMNIQKQDLAEKNLAANFMAKNTKHFGTRKQQIDAYVKKFSDSQTDAYRWLLAQDLIDVSLDLHPFTADRDRLAAQSRPLADIFISLGGKAVTPPKSLASSTTSTAQKTIPARPPTTSSTQKPTPARPPTTTAGTPQPGPTVAGQWHDPLAICRLRTKGLASIRGATFGMVRNGGKRPHQGIDLAVEPGTPVFAIANGHIVFTRIDNKNKNSYGSVIAIEVDVNDLPEPQRAYCAQHQSKEGTVIFFYAHLSSITEDILLKRTLSVTAGTMIGRSGSTGNARAMTTMSNGAHLHFEVRNSNKASQGLANRFDPLPLIQNCLNKGELQ